MSLGSRWTLSLRDSHQLRSQPVQWTPALPSGSRAALPLVLDVIPLVGFWHFFPVKVAGARWPARERIPSPCSPLRSEPPRRALSWGGRRRVFLWGLPVKTGSAGPFQEGDGGNEILRLRPASQGACGFEHGWFCKLPFVHSSSAKEELGRREGLHLQALLVRSPVLCLLLSLCHKVVTRSDLRVVDRV